MKGLFTSGHVSVLAMVSVLGMAVAGCASSQPATRGMYNWETGLSSAYELSQEQTQTLEIPGQGSQVNDSSVMMKMKVDATSPLHFKLSVTDASATGSPISVDPIVGLETDLTLNPSGKIESASGLEGNTYVDGMGGAEVFQESLQSLFQLLPDGGLKAGSEWTRSSSTPIERMGTELVRKVDETYKCEELTTFAGVQAFRISVDGEVSLTGSGNQGGADFDFSVQGKVSGTNYIDAATGRLLSSEQKGSLAGVIGMAQADIPITIDTTTSAKLVQ